MPNLYASLTDLKSIASITGTTYDAQLMDALEEGSRQFDKDTERFFYIFEGTYYQDGGATRVILDWDVQTITSLAVDVDGSMTYSNTYNVDMNLSTPPSTAPDAFVYPANSLPKTRIEANPYGQYGHFGAGFRKSIQIIGAFGYGNDWPASYTHANANVFAPTSNSTATTITMTSSSDTVFEAGMTLLVTGTTAGTPHEQVFITQATSSTSYVVQRAQNGTTAVVPGTTATVAVYDYPHAVSKAVLIYAMRIWKRRESAFQNQVGNPELGTVTVWKGNDPDYDSAVLKYKKPRRMWYL